MFSGGKDKREQKKNPNKAELKIAIAELQQKTVERWEEKVFFNRM